MTVVRFEPVGQGASAVCEECGRTYYGPPTILRNRRWCSWECRTATPRDWRSCERVPWRCEACGLERLQQPSEVYRRFCSLKCRDVITAVERQKRVEVACGHCGKRFQKRPSEIKIGRGKFCSRRCAGLGRPLNGRPSKVASAAVTLFASRHPDIAVEPEKRVSRYSIDLAVPHLRLAIELDGVYWHSLPAIQAKDRRKTADLEQAGWTVLRVVIAARATPEEVADQIEEIWSAHLEALHAEHDP